MQEAVQRSWKAVESPGGQQLSPEAFGHWGLLGFWGLGHLMNFWSVSFFLYVWV